MAWPNTPMFDPNPDTRPGHAPMMEYNIIIYIPVLNKGIGYCQVDTDKQDADVFIGNFLVCDQSEIFITVIKAEKGVCIFEINNPTEKPVTVTVRPSKGFDLVGDFAETVSLPVGGFKTVTIDF